MAKKKRPQMQKPANGVYRQPQRRSKKKAARKAKPMLVMAQWYKVSPRMWGCRRWDLEASVSWIDGGWHWIITDKKRKRVYARSVKPTTRSRKARREAMSAFLKVEAGLVQVNQPADRALPLAA